MKVPAPTISVIATFYNLEESVSYCLDSLLNQTYKDYELICVDDGSTDGTGVLLDGYAERDDRVHVYHKENGGAADSRNYGVQKSRGELLSFVDGDDVLSPYYLEVLFWAQDNREERMAIGLHACIPLARAQKSDSLVWDKPGKARELTKQELIEAMLYEEILTSTWGRLAPRSLYIANPSPVGDWYEDIATAGIFANGCDSFVLIEEPVYGYVMKPGSVVHKKNATMKQAKDYQKAIASFVSSASLSVQNEAPLLFFQALEYIRLYRLLGRVCDSNSEVSLMKVEIEHFISEHKRTLLRDSRISLFSKVRILLMGISPRLLMKLSDFYDKGVRGVSYK